MSSTAAPAVAVGDSREVTVVDDLTRTQIVQYAGASGDFNPIHTDEAYTTQVLGLPGVFAHGMLTMALTGRALTDWFGHDRLLTFSARFRSQVWPGDTLTTTATVTGLRTLGGAQVAEVGLVTLNQAGDEVLTGAATVRLTGPAT